MQKIRKVRSHCARIPCLFYGRVEPDFYFQLGKIGITDLFDPGEIDRLLEKLRDLHARASFSIDWRDFGIDIDKCGFWTRKFLQLVATDFNFLKYRTVAEIVRPWSISQITLNHVFKKDGLISPKQILLCLRNYYAAFLLNGTPLITKEIASRCGFPNEPEFYKSFRNKTGITVKIFSKEYDWHQFPVLYLKNMDKNPENPANKRFSRQKST